MDAHTDAFGAFRVTAEMGQGRFGPVFQAEDPETGRPVVVRTFVQPFDSEQRFLVVQALEWLCRTSLDHASIARPLAAGEHGTEPYLVNSYLHGTPLDEYLRHHGPQPLPEVVLRVTQLAAAIDFAAAVGVHHGSMGPRDIIVDVASTGVTGMGLVQAMAIAGIEVNGRGPYSSPARLAGESPMRIDDVYSLAAIAYELLYGVPLDEGQLESVPPLTDERVDVDQVRTAFADGLASDPSRRPDSALAFAASLQRAVAATPAAASPIEEPKPVAVPVPDGLVDFPIREEDPHPIFASMSWSADAAFEPARAEASVPSVADPPPASVPEPLRPPLTSYAVAAPRPRRRGFALAAMLAVGLVFGFAAGFVAREPDLFKPSAASSPAPTSPVAVGTTNRAQATNDRTATDVTVSEPVSSAPTSSAPAATSSAPAATSSAPASTPSASAPTPPPVSAPTTPQPAAAPRRSNQRPQIRESSRTASTSVSAPVAATGDTAGTLQILSRPSGAQVFIDGALVGQTPLVLNDVRAGEHVVRLDLSGYRRWVTSVRVDSRARARVAASLEQ